MRRAPGARERRLVLACLVGAREGLARLADGVGWDAALDLAAANAVLEPVAHALLGAAPEALPGSVRSRLSEASAAAAARNALLLHELGRVQAVLHGAGVPSAALKGAALVAAPGASPAARHLSDGDVLVAPADLARAAEALAAAGLTAAPSPLVALDGRSGPLPRGPTTPHVAPLETWGGALLELHDRLPGGGPPAEEVIGAARTVTFAGAPLALAAPDDLAGMLCRHVLVHHAGEARMHARHVADLVALEGVADWRRVEQRWGGGPGRRALCASRALVEAARREAAGVARAPRRLGLLEPVPPLLARAARLAALLRQPAPRLVRTLFPARRYMEARYGLPPGSRWTSLAYPWRLVRGAARLISGR